MLKRFLIRTYNEPYLTGRIADIFLAHYQGDERSSAEGLDISRVGCLGGILTSILNDAFEGLVRDPEPPDNDLIIDLGDGSWAQPGKEP
jgi:hypothetical protein